MTTSIVSFNPILQKSIPVQAFDPFDRYPRNRVIWSGSRPSIRISFLSFVPSDFDNRWVFVLREMFLFFSEKKYDTAFFRFVHFSISILQKIVRNMIRNIIIKTRDIINIIQKLYVASNFFLIF